MLAAILSAKTHGCFCYEKFSFRCSSHRSQKRAGDSKRFTVQNAGGFVEDSRVNGMLALSRALGDFEYKNNPMFNKHMK